MSDPTDDGEPDDYDDDDYDEDETDYSDDEFDDDGFDDSVIDDSIDEPQDTNKTAAVSLQGAQTDTTEGYYYDEPDDKGFY